MNKLTYNKDTFLLDEKPFRILSGAIHYFRVLPEYWEDRLKKLKACGFNTVETYCCWNLHEKHEGEFDFSGMLDLKKFLETANKLGLKAIVRPGPFICAEFDFGGLPYWLNKYGLSLRCNDPLYVSKVEAYFNKLLAQLKPLLASNGGNIIAMQIENEYGSYGNDKDYLRAIADIYVNNGIDCLLFTSDGPGDFFLSCGTLPEYLATCNFGSRGADAFNTFRKYRQDEPFMCMEFWNGWFDHWGEEHHTRPPQDTVVAMNEILDQNGGNGNLNFYMFHGGTNFAFTAGANHYEQHDPTVTSYDYDCPLTEWGDMTEKYHLVKAALEERYGRAEDIPVENIKKLAYGKVELTEKAGLFSNLGNLSTPHTFAYPQTFEDLDLAFGFMHYTATLHGDFGDESELSLDGLRDRAIIYINGELKGIKEGCRKRNDKIMLTFKDSDNLKLDILVENMGRTNFGMNIGEKKGIVKGVRVGQVHQSGFTMYPMELTDLKGLEYKDAVQGQPIFHRGYFNAHEICDTFMRLDGFTKGVAFINGFNLGRYWNELGPQKTLYVPAPLLKKGKNEIIIFELEKTSTSFISLTDIPDLG